MDTPRPRGEEAASRRLLGLLLLQMVEVILSHAKCTELMKERRCSDCQWGPFIGYLATQRSSKEQGDLWC